MCATIKPPLPGGEGVCNHLCSFSAVLWFGVVCLLFSLTASWPSAGSVEGPADLYEAGGPCAAEAFVEILQAVVLLKMGFKSHIGSTFTFLP